MGDSSEDGFELIFDSDHCRRILIYLNRTCPRENAGYRFEYFSGGFRFDDERPEIIKCDEDELGLPSVTLLRYLFAYRVSLVRGKPRSDLAHWWELAQAKAPNWAGFAKTRCSADSKELADECAIAAKKMSDDFDALDERWARSKQS